MDTGPLTIENVFGTTSGSPRVVKSSLSAVSGKKRRPLESSDNYPHIVSMLSSGTRVIECRDRQQWIIQRRIGREWRNKLYFRDKAALLRHCRPKTARLLALPKRFGADA